MAWPPPVTTATRPFRSYFLRYMLLVPLYAKSGAHRLAVAVEAMDAVGARRQADLVAGGQRQLARRARGHAADRVGIYMQEGVGAEMLRHAHHALPVATIARRREML